MNSGIIYQLSGVAAAELCVVSLWSLRQHYAGPVTVFTTSDCDAIARLITDDQRLHVKTAPLVLCGGTRPHWVAKTFTYLQSPYDYSIYLDSDTVVLADPTPLFGQFTVTKCNDLRILDDHGYPRAMRRSLARFRGKHGPVLDGMIDRLYKANCHIVNAGVIAFAREHPILWELHHLSVGLRHAKMYDEAAMQLCLPHHPTVRFAEGIWNALFKYEIQWDERQIAHYHHKYYAYKHPSRTKWLPSLLAALDANAAGIRDWVGQYNPRVAGLLIPTPTVP